MLQTRIELATLGLWDLRAANCATGAAGRWGKAETGPEMRQNGQILAQSGRSERIGAAEARWAHNPKVPRSKLGFASYFALPVSLDGQDRRLSPARPGFDSRTGNFCIYLLCIYWLLCRPLDLAEHHITLKLRILGQNKDSGWSRSNGNKKLKFKNWERI